MSALSSNDHDSVAYFLTNEIMRKDCAQTLKGAPDMARALSRIALNRGGPRDILSVAQGLAGRLRAQFSIKPG